MHYQGQKMTEPGRFARMIIEAVRTNFGMLKLSSILDTAQALVNTKDLQIERNYSSPVDPHTPVTKLYNREVSCLYALYRDDDGDICETLNIIRTGYDGGAILYFKQGALVRGLIDAQARIFFYDEEVTAAADMLIFVRKQLEGVSHVPDLSRSSF
jgi:hypothetical protein